MPKFTFISEDLNIHGYKTGSKLTKEFTCEPLGDVINEFEMFIRGSGYSFDGGIDILDTNDYSDTYVSYADTEYVSVLKKEIEELKIKFNPNEEGTGHYNTAIGVLQERIKEIQSSLKPQLDYPTGHYSNIK